MSMRNDPNTWIKVKRLFIILRGLFQGANTHSKFAVLFDWFYPDHFAIIKKCMDIYIQDPVDDEIVVLILKFLCDLLDNSSNRLRFDTWSINGLIVYKESSLFITQFMEKFNFLSP